MNTVITKPDFDEIEATLSSLEYDWKIREEGMQILVNNMGHTIYQRQSFDRVASFAKVLALQHSDLRSAIVKQASEVVQEAALLTKKYKNLKLYRFSDAFLKEQPFLKALGSANKVIAKHAASAIQALSLHHCIGFETLIQFYAMCKSNKIIAVRERLAEAILAFVKNVIYPPKVSAISLYSELDVCENLNSSGQMADDHTMIIEKPNNSNIVSKVGSFSRPRTSQREKGPMQKSAKVKVDTQADDEFRVKKLYPEDLNFFKEATETLIKDAAAPVRNIAKSIKSELEKLEAALNSIADDKDSDESRETAEEHEHRQRFVSHERPSFRSKSRPNSKTNTGSLNFIALNQQNSKGLFLIEQNKISKPTSERKEIPKPSMLLQEQPRTKTSQMIIDILSDHKVLAKEKVEEVDRILNSENRQTPNFTLEQYLELLKLTDTAKNVALKEMIIRLMTSTNITDYKVDLFETFVAKRLLRKVTLNSIINYLITQLGLMFLTEAFITHQSDEIAGLLDRTLSPDVLAYLYSANPQVIESVIGRITKNIALCTTNPDVGTKFESENFSIFEKLMTNEKTASICARFSYDTFFLEWLRRTSPSLHKFLQVDPQSNEKVTENRSAFQIEHPLESPMKNTRMEIEIPKVKDLMRKANLSTRKNILKSLIGHTAKLGSKDVSAAVRSKIIAKTLEILKCTAEAWESNDEETLSAAYTVTIELLSIPMDSSQMSDLFDNVMMLCRNHSAKSMELSACYLSQMYSKEPSSLRALTQQIQNESSPDKTVELLKLTARSFNRSVENHVSPQPLLQHIEEFVQYVRNALIIHPEVSIRKHAVNFLVQAFLFVGPEMADRFNTLFTPEQQMLISVYVKKAAV